MRRPDAPARPPLRALTIHGLRQHSQPVAHPGRGRVHFAAARAPRVPGRRSCMLHGITESRRYFSGPLGALARPLRALHTRTCPASGSAEARERRYSMDRVPRSRTRLRRSITASTSVRSGSSATRSARWPSRSSTRAAIPTACSGHASCSTFPGTSLPDEAHGIIRRGSPSYQAASSRRIHSREPGTAPPHRPEHVDALRAALPWTVLADARKFTLSLADVDARELPCLNYRRGPDAARAPSVGPLLIHGDVTRSRRSAHVAELPGALSLDAALAIPGPGTTSCTLTDGRYGRHSRLSRGFLEMAGRRPPLRP